VGLLQLLNYDSILFIRFLFLPSTGTGATGTSMLPGTGATGTI